MPEMTIERFETLFIPEPMSGCWLWLGPLHSESKPYGRFNANTVTYAAHRWSFHHYKHDPGSLWVLHHCDNPTCVNPDHLVLGTAQDNSSDMVRKQRQNRGTSVNKAKADENLVRYIRAYKGGVAELARIVGLSRASVQKIRRGDTWRHVEGGLPSPRLNHGEHNRLAKLTTTIVREITARHASGEAIKALAREYKVNPQTLRNAIRGRTWKAAKETAE